MAATAINAKRRTLLQVGGCAAALGSVPGAWGMLAPPKSPLAELTAESFQPYKGQEVVFARPATGGAILTRSVRLKLTEVAVHEHIVRIEAQDPARYEGKRARSSFSVFFELRDQEPLTEGLHRLIHEDFAGCQLYLSQVSRPRPDGTLLYEAVFG